MTSATNTPTDGQALLMRDKAMFDALSSIGAGQPSRPMRPYYGSLDGLADSMAAANAHRLRGEDR